jgi:hypothetical protein
MRAASGKFPEKRKLVNLSQKQNGQILFGPAKIGEEVEVKLA